MHLNYTALEANQKGNRILFKEVDQDSYTKLGFCTMSIHLTGYVVEFQENKSVPSIGGSAD